MRATDNPADSLDRLRFPAEEWALTETSFSGEDLGTTETLFAVGNGYLGMRGTPEEGRPAHAHGTFINGFHETWRIRHAEDAYGFATTGQTIVNVPDASVMKLYVDDEPFVPSAAEILDYRRSLDFREGVLRREIIWRTPAGVKVRVATSRMVSFTERHLAIVSMEVELLDGDAPVVISSQILNREDGQDEYYNPTDLPPAGFDPRKAAEFDHRVLEPRGHWHSERRMVLGYQTANSGMTIAVGADHTIETENPVEPLISTEPDIAKRVYRVDATAGRPIKVTKVVAYHTSSYVPVRELFDRCRRTLDRVRDGGVAGVYEAQRAWLTDFWASSDVEIVGQPALAQAARWCIFQLAQASARADGQGVAAKGVSGSGYEGHYFWDTEVYVVPFLTWTNPHIARNLLRFRYSILPNARERARELAQRGALFPWRTITGDEASAYYAAGTAQYHIDADVAFAFSKYADITGDEEFMLREGSEVLVETARMWADLGFWRVTGTDQTFHIHGVTGPDEYTTVVNNNLFTNVMARANLRHAAALMRRMRADHTEDYLRLAQKLDLDEAEIIEWEACAEAMTIPYDETLEIHPQDEDFLVRELWDVPNTPPEKRPLLLHYHPLVIYRFQVLKQADVVLALFLQGDQFSLDVKRRDFDYYDPITTGDSTLSAVVQSIIAAEVGYDDLALDYFLKGLFVDLADLHRNTSDGVHIASAGGVWNALVYGFAGLRDYESRITFDPRLPVGWEGLTFPLTYQGSRFRVCLEQKQISFAHETGSTVTVHVRGTDIEVRPGSTAVVPLADQGERRVDEPEFSVVGELRGDGSLITADVPGLDLPKDEVGLLGLVDD